jgi:hypothetical protein
MANKIDSNITGLRYTPEASLGVLPGSPVWTPLEPNGYGDFGGQLTTMAREPISPSRQRKKGVVTDLDASAGFSTDLTQDNLTELLAGFMFAAWRLKARFGGSGGITAVDGSTEEYQAASGLDAFAVGDLLLASGFTNDANNGLKRVTSVTATDLGVAQDLVAETPPAAATLKLVGRRAGTGDLNVVVTGGVPAITSTALDFTDLGLIPGEWVYIGGDSAGTAFATAGNNGFARVKAVAAHALTLEKSDGTMANETGTGLTVELYVGDVLKNEADPALIVRKSLQFERSLGDAGYEYIVGAVPSTVQFNVATADKITVDVAYVGTDHEQAPVTARKSGTFPVLASGDAFNTSSDFSRLRMALSDGTRLFAYLTELSLTVDNNLSPNKAVSVLGAFDVTAGMFAVSGSLTAYFSDIAAVQAVRSNADVTLDFAVVKNNAGLLVDVPLVALGDGRLNVEKDSPITIPLTADAAAHPTYNHTLLIDRFDYLPDAAE